MNPKYKLIAEKFIFNKNYHNHKDAFFIYLYAIQV